MRPPISKGDARQTNTAHMRMSNETNELDSQSSKRVVTDETYIQTNAMNGSGEEKLPKEIWLEIAKHLDDTSLVSFGAVCSTFRKLRIEQVEEPARGQIWRALLNLDARIQVTRGWFDWAMEVLENDSSHHHARAGSCPCAREKRREREKRFYLLAKLAAMHGYLDELKEILRDRPLDGKVLCSDEFFCTNRHDDDICCIFEAGAMAGETEVLKWLIRKLDHRTVHYRSFLKHCMVGAKEGHHEETYQWLRYQYLCSEINTVEAWDSWNSCPIS